MNTQDITEQIRDVLKAIDNLSTAQSHPMHVQIRFEIGNEINRLYDIVQDMAQIYHTKRD